MATAALSREPLGLRSPTVSTVSAEVEPWLDRFETIYREAAGDPARIPWAHRQPCPWLVTWLNAEAPNVVRAGARAAVVGCGLGQDACLLRERGYEVTAFDACPSAVEWARTLHPEAAESFLQADLLNLPGRMLGRFDLVVEVHTLQSVPPACWPALAEGITSLLSHRGVLVAIARGRHEDTPPDGADGPPWPLTRQEIESLFAEHSLVPLRPVDEFLDESDPPVRRIRGAFRRA